MTDTHSFFDTMSQQTVDIKTDDVHMITRIGVGTGITLFGGVCYVVTTHFSAVCREFGYCDAE